MKRIFISYSQRDRERVLGLKALLELAGVEVFVDSHSIQAGTRWEKEIARALENSDAMCVFWTAAASKSIWVEREYTTFLQQYPSKVCVPLCADAQDLPPLLAARQALPGFLDLTNELLACGRKLGAMGVSRAEQERQVRSLLANRGVVLKEREINRVVLLSLGGLAGASLTILGTAVTSNAARYGALSLVIGGGVTLVILGSGSGPEPSPTTSERRSDLPEKPGKIAKSETPPSPRRLDVQEHDEAPLPPAIRRKPGNEACHFQPGTDLETRAFEDPKVSSIGNALCGYLDQALQASERDFANLVSGSGRADGKWKGTQVSFPLCEEPPGAVTWDTKLVHSSLPDCEIKRFMLADNKTTGAPESMFQTCSKGVPPQRIAMAEYQVLKRDVAYCLTTENGWTTHEPDHPLTDANGVLILHGARDGMARIYYDRKGDVRSWSVSIVLRGDEDISEEAAAAGKRAESAILELHVALSSLSAG